MHKNPKLFTLRSIFLFVFLSNIYAERFAYTWFIFDDNSTTNPGATRNSDGIASPAESIKSSNYRIVTRPELICSGTANFVLFVLIISQVPVLFRKPALTSTDQVRTAIDQYHLFNDIT